MNSNPQTVNASFTSPPRPALAFRVGVVGHRPNRLKEADMNKLGTLIHDMLKVIKEEVESFKVSQGHFFDNSKPVLRALSPLAEGSDRLFAEQALSLGYELCCVMPFFKEEFEKDFIPGKALEVDSLIRFNNLLSKASMKFELDGTRVDEPAAYGTAGDVVLNQSDVLIVVWDGVRQDKQGGTEETMDAAIRMGVEVIWINARAPHSWQIINAKKPLPESANGKPLSPTDSFSLDKIMERVKEVLDLPHIDEEKINNQSKVIKDEDPEKAIITFYSEKKPKWRVSGFIWKSFRDLFGNNKLRFKSLREEDFEESVSGEWPRDTSSPVARIVNSLRPFYAWIDKPAVIYSDKYRAAYIIIFLLAAFSVGMALLPVWLNYPLVASFSIAAEFISIVIILVIYSFGKKRQWQRRWLDYRTGAELIRHLRLIAPLGGKRPYPQVPAHWTAFGQIGSSWMAWYVQAIERKLGLPNTRIDKDYLKKNLTHIKEYIDGQINFHEVTSERCFRIEYRLHKAGILMLILTLIACAIHLLHALSIHIPLPGFLTPGLLIFVTGFCPALGAAFAGINSQGEFRRVAKRSEVMRDQLELLLKRVKKLEDVILSSSVPGGIQYSVKVTSIVSEAGRMFVNEVLDWRVVFLDQPLKT